MKVLNYIFISIFGLYLISCHALSPSIQAPVKPLAKGDFQIQASLETMPETNKDAFNLNYSGGECLTLRYGFNDFFTLQAKAWIPNHNYENSPRYGMALMPIFYLYKLDTNFVFFLTPAFNFYMNGSDLNYLSIGTYAGLMLELSSNFGLYGALSYHNGIDCNSSENSGNAFTANAGLRYKISKIFDINFECTYTYLNPNVHSTYYDNSEFKGYFTPLVGIGVNL